MAPSVILFLTVEKNSLEIYFPEIAYERAEPLVAYTLYMWDSNAENVAHK